MKSERTVRWGILGCARITRRGLIPGIRESNSGSLVALASRNGETAKEWCEEFGVPQAFSSYEELIASPDVDAVYIPLPNELHKQWVFSAADAGKHILCEKPLALNAGEAEEMAAHCAAKDVVLMEAFMWRHQPRTAAIEKLVKDGTIGTLRLIRASFSFPIDLDDWRLDPARGGGALWDVGCYGVSTARLFAGEEPEQIQAQARFYKTGVDLSLTASLRFPSGVLAQVDCSFEQAFRCAYELVGTRGTIGVPEAYLPPADQSFARIIVDGAVQNLGFPGTNQYAMMVDSFGEAVAMGGRLPPPAENGVGQMRALDAILAAAHAGRR
jgi:D-xylose 1-dehydrogenase (NADP+, D-xylono-1,5-lactone-forming)